ncbi:Putative 115 kDa protein in type-1 retrotransposable element [Sparassis crispa]|uniref:115 kDa protein in type-1 retrotransposable element n=1 Tax=Sparassis crispa TaxID=139825 RepID=A0A401GJA8_9APHY|nr:Putative 115 kDa protein in type-1 retrotransposable element [Sparassis crispa]GBE82248.1 Putative 115 kDa protein in type-1 retrotransposable element [Sparassis crispa]
MPKGKRPRAMAYVRKRADFTVTLRSDLANDLDMQILEVQQAPHPTTLIVNIYNDNKKQGKRSAVKRLQKVALPNEIPVILSGDWNLHHPLWSRHATPANEIMERTVDWLTERGFSIQNEKGEPAFFSHSHKTYSTIDLTFLNPRATELNATKKWTIDRTKAFGSDHFALHWELDYRAVEIENVTGKKYNFKDADLKEWKAAFQVALNKCQAHLNVLLNLEDTMTTEQLDGATDALTEAMQAANEMTVPIRKPSDKARPWWNDALEKVNKRIAQQRSANLEHNKRWGMQSPAIAVTIKKSCNYFKCLYKTSRDKWITKTLEDAETKDIWSFGKWGKGERTYQSPAISQGPNKPPAVHHTDKCEALQNELFQPPPPLENAQIPDLATPGVNDFMHEPLTKEEVKNSIFDQGADKAPGLSQNPFRAIRWAWEVADSTITALMHHCLKTGYHPKAW